MHLIVLCVMSGATPKLCYRTAAPAGPKRLIEPKNIDQPTSLLISTHRSAFGMRGTAVFYSFFGVVIARKHFCMNTTMHYDHWVE